MRKLPKENMKNILVETKSEKYYFIYRADFIDGKFYSNGSELSNVKRWFTIEENNKIMCRPYEGQKVILDTDNESNEHPVCIIKNAVPYDISTGAAITDEVVMIHGKYKPSKFGDFIYTRFNILLPFYFSKKEDSVFNS